MLRVDLSEMSFGSNSYASYLSFSSDDDPESSQPAFNPANFNIYVPNSIKCQDVVRICNYNTTVPRMFPTVTPNNNTLIYYRRQIIEIQTDVPNVWFRTVSNDWLVWFLITLPLGIQNVAEMLAYINLHHPVVGDGETWTSLPDATKTIQINIHPVDPLIAWGLFSPGPGYISPIMPPNPPIFLPISWLSSARVAPGEQKSVSSWGAFDLLGLTQPPLDPRFTPTGSLNTNNPSTFGTVVGTNLEKIGPKLPLFIVDNLFGYSQFWNPYQTPVMNPPNVSGPDVVHVALSDLGDGSTTYAFDGSSYDVLTTVSLSGVNFGDNATKEVKDGEFEAIALRQPRNITGFRVTLYDSQFRVLTLPRNYPVNMRLQMVYVSR